MENINYSNPMIIFHSADCDGIFSSWIVREFLHSKNVKDNNIMFFAWNYSKDIDSEKMKKASVIFIVDVTLPDNYMTNYANKIVWIDHHYGAITRSKDTDWYNKLYKIFSSITFPESNKQISACELCWISLFNSKIPEMVQYAGRYDVWDKSTMEPDYLNAYTRENFLFGTENLRNPLTLKATLNFLDEMFKLSKEEFRKKILDEGKKYFIKRKERNKYICDETASIAEIYGEKIAIANYIKCNSEFFDSIFQKDNDIKYFICFGYNLNEENWKISIYNSPSNDSGSSLNILEKLYSENKELFLSHGGHKGACGAVVTNIQISLLDKVKKIN